MGIFDFLGQKTPPAETKESAASATMVVNPGQPVWTPREYDRLAHEAYVINVIGYQAVNKVAESVSMVKWSAWRGETEVTESPLLDLIARPNPDQSYADYVQRLIAFRMIAGNTYEEQVPIGNEPKELYVLRPDRMKVTADASGQVSQYTYQVGGKKVIFDANDDLILHTKTFHPTNDWYGLSAVEAAARAVDQNNEGMNWVQALLQNSARPSGALVNEGELTEDNFNRLKVQIEEQYSGARNAGRPMLLEGGLDWKAMGLSPNDMQVIESNNAAARNIALAFGVPPQLLGIPGDNTYSNYQEARLAFWEDTVIPTATAMGDAWNRWLSPMFGDIELRPEFDHIPAIADKRSTMFDMAEKSSFLTLNEKRKMAGFEPISGGDVVMSPMNSIPFGSDPDIETDIKAAAKLAGYEFK
jgi:HK97 family phage portal protein